MYSPLISELTAENKRLKTEVERLNKLVSVQQAAHATDEKGMEDFRKAVKSLEEKALTILVVGASGHLARTKTFPALYALFVKDLLPSTAHIIGFARTPMTDQKFHETLGKISSLPKGGDFLKKCSYFAGQYDSIESFKKLAEVMRKIENGRAANRVFYLAIPPQVFAAASSSLRAGAVSATGWNRIIVEKPFGRDSETSAVLSKALAHHFSESEIFRIDHYLGKEMVMNLMVLRFANTVFEPIWNRNYIQSVLITFKEEAGVEGRGGYFDEFGIIRDVMQNHLLQMAALVAMEPPVTLSAEDVRNEKVKVMRAVSPLTMENLRIGQYGSNGKGAKAYRDDPTVPHDSLSPTFAVAVLHVRNPRWDGVPFILKCGKGLNERKAELRVQFKPFPGTLFEEHTTPMLQSSDSSLPAAGVVNELVLRVQPDEAIYLKMCAKTPGLSETLEQTELDLTYRNRFRLGPLPDAYERLILDVLRGDHNLFVRSDELAASWEIFTPILHQMEKDKTQPETYPFGSRGPASSDKLIAEAGVVRSAAYQWHPATRR